ncbi:MAG: glycosyltransferase [Planctomycetes bacterium]|nr:glycosyltransferase [Planctomycetota bacterium]
MKIAVFHNFMDNIGGAEIVSLTLTRELNACLYTTNIDIEKIKQMGFGDVVSRIYSIGKIPKKAPFRHQIAFWKFRRLNLKNKFDFYIISGDWAMSGAVNNHPNLWYIHSPLNELWQFKDYVRENLMSVWKRPFFDLWVWFNRKLSLKYSKKVDNWVCNSKNTKERINKFYRKEAKIIYPPIDTEGCPVGNMSGDYWLSVNRLVNHKRIEMQLNAFLRLPNEKLIIVGSYEEKVEHFEQYKNLLEKIKPPNVTFIHWADSNLLKKLYLECRGFITTAIDEDFGMTVVEAMAYGKPIIAPNTGGYKESVISGETGFLIDGINEDKIKEAVINISNILKNNPLMYTDKSRLQAKKFDKKVFVSQIKEIVK